MIVLTIIYIVDEITSNVNSAMQPYALFDLFKIGSRDVNSVEYKTAINTVAPWQVASNLFLIVSPFYKALSDRFGRRLFLMINTIGILMFDEATSALDNITQKGVPSHRLSEMHENRHRPSPFHHSAR